MMWIKLTTPDGKPVWVNLARVAQMSVGEFWQTGRETTRLYTGALTWDGCGTVDFTIDVAESPDDILNIAGVQ